MPGYSFELRFPGTWIDGLDDGIAFKASSSLQIMSISLVDVAYALTEFEVSRTEYRAQKSAKDFRTVPPLLRAVMNRRPFIYAKIFVGELDMLVKHLEALERLIEDPSGVSAAKRTLQLALPDLKHVRDSVQHADERAHGRSNKGEIVTKPIDELGIQAPGGSIMVMEMLNDHVFSYTTANGELGKVPVNVNSLSAAVQAVQTAIDSFAWRGPPSTSPS